MQRIQRIACVILLFSLTARRTRALKNTKLSTAGAIRVPQGAHVHGLRGDADQPVGREQLLELRQPLPAAGMHPLRSMYIPRCTYVYVANKKLLKLPMREASVLRAVINILCVFLFSRVSTLLYAWWLCFWPLPWGPTLVVQFFFIMQIMQVCCPWDSAHPRCRRTGWRKVTDRLRVDTKSCLDS